MRSFPTSGSCSTSPSRARSPASPRCCRCWSTGSPGRRSILPHARIVLHQPHADGSRGSISDLALEAAELARVRGQGEALLARHTGRSADQIRHDTDRALVLTGEQAVEYGIVDQVLSSAGSGGHAEHATALRPDG